ncbi:MAG: tyrosine--tRNA ligase [bacterium]|nr:tyrosine--tRNA ligase [bacterium]
MRHDLLKRAVAEVIEQRSLEEKLKRGDKLRIKLGVDPTSPDIHLGHMVVINKLREFQQIGHKIILIIGDYTARIGDPSGKKKTRPILTEKEIESNSKTYLKQVGKVLNVSASEVVRNSKWFSKFSFADWLDLLSKFTVAQILERDDFSNRFKSGIDIGMHELVYPAMQAYDSIMVKSDLEIGGTDQKFNMLAGRDLQRKMGQKPQDIITVPILVGTDGREKMSKSLGNAIGVAEKPTEIYGKVMSIPDNLILPFFSLATDISDGGLKMVEKELVEGANPRDVKARLAYLIVETYYDSEQASLAGEYFDETCRDKKIPNKMPILEIKRNFSGSITDLISIADHKLSKSQVRRLIDQGGVKIDGQVVRGASEKISVIGGMKLQIGKRRFFRVKFE